MSYISALFIFAISVLVYVTIGGFRAVAITDAIQGSIMFIGTLILLIAVIIAGGGIPNIISDLTAENPNLITPYGAEGTLTPQFVSSFWIRSEERRVGNDCIVWGWSMQDKKKIWR